MAEKINDDLILYTALGLGLGLLVVRHEHEQEAHHWRMIHHMKRSRIAEGLREIHHGLYDLSHHDRAEGESLIERGAERIQRAEFGFPRHDLFHPG